MARTAGEPVRVLHLLPDMAAGGGQRLVLDLLSHLDPTRYQVSLAHIGTDTTMTAEYAAAGIVAHQLPSGSALASGAALAGTLRLMRQRRIDLVHTHGDREKRLGEAAAFLGRRPCIQHVHGMPGNPVAAETGPVQVAAHRRIISRLLQRHFIAVSEPAYERRRPYLEAAGDQIHLVRNGIDIARFARPLPDSTRERLRADLDLDGAQPVLISIGRLVKGKAMERLVPVMSRVRERRPGATLLVVGDGPERHDLETAFATAGLTGNIRLLGTRSDVPDLLGLADVFVFPTLREGFGLVAVEAMAAGVPIVASDLPALRAIIDHGRSGLLVPPDDDESLAAAVVRILDDPGLADELRTTARTVAAEHFDITASASALGAIYDTIAGVG